MLMRITVVVTSPRVAPGILTARAWDVVRTVPVLTASPTHPQLAALRAAGATVLIVDPGDPGGLAGAVTLIRAALPDPAAAEVAWLPDPLTPSILDRLLDEASGSGERNDAGVERVTGVDGVTGVEVTSLVATRELPGSSLLDAVAVMDRLRSPGGCPWDAEQTHTSLAPYLVEETYEAYQAIEDYDLTELREELGDVLMQVLFHARIAAERAEDGWDVDDVAAGLVAKLIRRHPHVFGDVVVDGPANVVANWDAIKAVEKGRVSVTEGVPLSQPALSLAAKLLKRAAGIGVPALALTGTAAWGVTDAGDRVTEIAATAAVLARSGTAGDDLIGDLLFSRRRTRPDGLRRSGAGPSGDRPSLPGPAGRRRGHGPCRGRRSGFPVRHPLARNLAAATRVNTDHRCPMPGSTGK